MNPARNIITEQVSKKRATVRGRRLAMTTAWRRKST